MPNNKKHTRILIPQNSADHRITPAEADALEAIAAGNGEATVQSVEEYVLGKATESLKTNTYQKSIQKLTQEEYIEISGIKQGLSGHHAPTYRIKFKGIRAIAKRLADRV
jgi:hypothetical protein